MGYKLFDIRVSDIDISECQSAIAQDFRGTLILSPKPYYNIDNFTTEYDTFSAHFNPIGFPNCLFGDGKYLISVNWTQGITVAEVDNTGSVNVIFYDSTPDPTSSNGNFHCAAVDKVRKIVYATSAARTGVVKLDFSNDWTNNPVSSSITTSNSNIQYDRMGISYINGMCLAGDWLYVTPNTTTDYNVTRWNTVTDTADNLATVTNNTRYSAIFYSEEHDVIYIVSLYTDGFIMVLDASTASPTVRDVNMTGEQAQGVMVIPNPNDINDLYFAGRSKFSRIDIEDVISGSTSVPTYINSARDFYDEEWPYTRGTYHRYGGNGSLNTIGNTWETALPMVLCDRGIGYHGGFVDLENNQPILMNGGTWFTYTGGRLLIYTYFSHPVKIVTDDSSVYWAISGQGSSDNGSLYIFDSPPKFESTTWRIQTNPLQLDSSGSIQAIKIEADEYQMGSATTTWQVSNNAGSTWETYTGGFHTFNSSGDTVLVRYNGTNTVNKTNYIRGKLIIEIYDSVPFRKYKILRTKISG
jgi:hypothetical protein